ncbi:MAG: hypothetical protein PVSMB1_15200 [Gemmatimonadaceae bacterium]
MATTSSMTGAMFRHGFAAVAARLSGDHEQFLAEAEEVLRKLAAFGPQHLNLARWSCIIAHSFAGDRDIPNAVRLGRVYALVTRWSKRRLSFRRWYSMYVRRHISRDRNPCVTPSDNRASTHDRGSRSIF